MTGVPRVVPIALAIAGLLYARRAFPGAVEAVILLLLVYLLATNVDRAAALVGAVPASLSTALRPSGG
jgi:hypothetical protein